MGRLEAKLKAKMVPSWVPGRRFWGSKNEAKMVTLSGASWGRHFHGFWVDLRVAATWPAPGPSKIGPKAIKNQQKLDLMGLETVLGRCGNQ